MVKYFFVSILLLLFASILQAVILVARLNFNSEHFELLFIFLSYVVLFIGLIRYDSIFLGYFSKFDLIIIATLILWFCFNIIRSIDIPLSNLSTLPRFLGGKFYAPALLVPFFVFLGSNMLMIRLSWELSKRTIGYFLLFSPLLFIYNAGIFMAFIGFLPLMVLNYDKLSKNEFIFVALVLAVRLAFCIVHGARTEFIRLAFYLAVALLFVNKNIFKKSLSLNIKGFVLVFILFLGFLYLYFGNLSKHFSDPKVVENIKSYERDNLNTDSRNMVYEDFVEDFSNWKDLLFGRGALGSTYSPQFIILQKISGNTTNVFNLPLGYRLEVESGYLNIVLKTGIIGLVLFLVISLRAIYLGVFRTQNTFTVMTTFIILERFLSMVSFGLPEYSLDYILFWLSIGVCLSEKIRSISNVEMFFLLRGGKYYSPKLIKRSNIAELGIEKST